MTKRLNILQRIYEQGFEDHRLINSRQGQLEYWTTMAQIHEVAPQGANILEIGAGTGRYAIALAKEGYHVTAIELIQENLDVLHQNAHGVKQLESHQGDALDLSRFDDGVFDLTLLLGPMYHLYETTDQHQALDEAIRVTKPGGHILIAFLPIYAVMYTNYLSHNFQLGMKENYTDDYEVKHFEEQGFTAFDVVEFESMCNNKALHHIKTVATDGILELAEANPSFGMSDEDFAAFLRYHLRICDKRELLGTSNHLLYIGQKQR
jgi:ubiquinone/menaquinone biosynthesis C-methylase UbiE